MCISYPTDWYFVAWISVFGYESIILLLGLRAGISYFKESRSLPLMFEGIHYILSCCVIVVECRVDVAAAKMGRDNLSAKSHDTKNPRKLGFVSVSVARAWPIGRTLNLNKLRVLATVESQPLLPLYAIPYIISTLQRCLNLYSGRRRSRFSHVLGI